jgi:hypothetical protein
MIEFPTIAFALRLAALSAATPTTSGSLHRPPLARGHHQPPPPLTAAPSALHRHPRPPPASVPMSVLLRRLHPQLPLPRQVISRLFQFLFLLDVLCFHD